MARNCLRINHEGDSIQLSWQRGQSMPRTAPSVAFTHPFDKEILAELRWYLEEYLSFPYGIFPDNATKIEQKFQDWGEELFELVFRRSEKAREFFQAATYDGLNQCQLVITSDSPEVLNLPWELLYSPSDRQFLAPSLAGMSRSLSDYPVRAEMGQLPQDKLNILLVIARPYGKKDIGLRTIARPLLQSLADIRQKVNLKVLRPPSFEQFERELNSNRGFYHIVHFDGHGNFDPDSTGFQHTLGVTGQGLLVFEKNDGSPDIVTATKIAQNLADCQVPIFVLNACKSAQEGEENFSSVASRLVSLGAKGVVAMAYSVYAEAAKHFIGRLYGELAAGATLDSAVAAGRKDVLNKPLRPSPKGDKPLQDWLIPVLYQQESYTPFRKVGNQVGSFEELMMEEDGNQEQATDELPEAGAYGFIGRDYEILRLERAFRQNQVVLLKGMAGVGKTELAVGFARWLQETQGREGIFFTSFETGNGLSNVINSIGRRLGGEKFSLLLPAKQYRVVLQYLQTHPCLLIWDNLEPVAGFPPGNAPLLSQEEREKLRQFLKQLRGGQSWVLITSRQEEPWLDCGYQLVSLSGLSDNDAEALAAKILQTAGVDRGKLPAEYLELLKLLRGHPLSLRVVLPHLKVQSPVQLIEALQQGLDTFQGLEEDRDKSLIVSLDYSFTKLSDSARRHLPFLGLFSQRVGANLFAVLANNPDEELAQAYQAVFGEILQEADWLKLLNEAAAAGILEYLGYTYHKIHPALPWYLRQQLTKQYPTQEVRELEKKLLDFYAELANTLREQLVGNAKGATFALRVEEPNLLQKLRFAQQQQDWNNAGLILQPLGEVYQRSSRQPEFRALRQQALAQIGSQLVEAKAKGQEAFDFWMYLRVQDANEATQSADLETAGAIHREILEELTTLNDPSMKDTIAVSYHNLGYIAQLQRKFEEATSYYRKALQIKENAQDWYNAASDYLNLGLVAQLQRKFEEAKTFHHKALQIYENKPDWYKAATVYRNLGIVAKEQRQYEEARTFHRKALQIYEDAQDWYNATSDYHQLGVLAQLQRKFEEATACYRKALQIREDNQDWYNAASDCHNLGVVAQEQGQLEEATAYYRKALQIYEDAQDWYSAAGDYQNLGVVAQEQKQFEEANVYFRRALQIYEDNQDWYNAARNYHNLGLVARQQRQFEKAKDYYQKAFGIIEQYQDWYNASDVLGKYGEVLEAQEHWVEALQIYIRVFAIDVEHNKEPVGSDIRDLGRMLKVLGASKFGEIWQEETGEEFPEVLHKAIEEASNK
ncbi:MAG: tetratricopeptide repeat protein [Symploca sp. SIO3E6]|nr:tetratricopeptide repeat protein [Caldora sp. SIO3E6]